MGTHPRADLAKIDFRVEESKGTRGAPLRYAALYAGADPAPAAVPAERRCILANLLTAARVLLIFVIIAVWMRADPVGSWWLDLLMVPLLGWAIFMDALDGWAARRYNETSEAGALFDIAGDRIVELVLWTFFAIRTDTGGQPLVPMWVPLVMITRTVVTDLIRSVAFAQGRTPFGPNSMQQTAWGRQLTSARWSRAAYGGLKALCFCGLGVRIALPDQPWLRTAVDAMVIATVAFSVLRAVPVVWDGRAFLTHAKARSGRSARSPE